MEPQGGADGSGLVLVPIQAADPQADRTVVELRRMPDGQLALPIFSDLDALVAGCGPAQPWMLLPTERLADLRAELGFDGVIVDVELPAAHHEGDGDG